MSTSSCYLTLVTLVCQRLAGGVIPAAALRVDGVVPVSMDPEACAPLAMADIYMSHTLCKGNLFSDKSQGSALICKSLRTDVMNAPRPQRARCTHLFSLVGKPRYGHGPRSCRGQ